MSNSAESSEHYIQIPSDPFCLAGKTILWGISKNETSRLTVNSRWKWEDGNLGHLKCRKVFRFRMMDVLIVINYFEQIQTENLQTTLKPGHRSEIGRVGKYSGEHA